MHKGIVLVSASALFFALATVFAKIITNNSQIAPLEITFFRFFYGFVAAFFFMYKSRLKYFPNNFKLVSLRVIFNLIAVILFFYAVKKTTVTNANMLNMTYPAFVFLIAPFFNKEKNIPVYYLYLVLTFIGIYFVAVPDFSKINSGDLLALASAVTAGMAISILREARKYDSTTLIIFYLMGAGMILNGIILIPYWVTPNIKMGLLIFLSAISGVSGQICITAGYKYISAAGGALVSSLRIVIAAILGIAIFSDPFTIKIIFGGLLILISLIGISGGWKHLLITKQQK